MSALREARSCPIITARTVAAAFSGLARYTERYVGSCQAGHTRWRDSCSPDLSSPLERNHCRPQPCSRGVLPREEDGLGLLHSAPAFLWREQALQRHSPAPLVSR